MKKVGIVTVYNACNYGSFLQAYALSQYLIEHQHQVDFLEIPVDYKKVVSAENADEQYSKYEEEKYKKLVSDQEVFNVVKKLDKTYQSCVIGSDTIWNMFDSTYENIPYFVGKGIDCDNIISYAASVGQSRLSKILVLKGMKLLPIRKLNHIAVRDDKTEKLVKLFGKKYTRVLDPTFLYDFKDEKPENAPESPYLLVYTYGYGEEQIKAIKKYAKEHQLTIVATGSLCKWADLNLAVGSFEWLWLVKHAEMIVTGTFHGSVFSIKYNKKFAVLTNGSDKVSSLLKEFKLGNRLATTETLAAVLGNEIDYNKVNPIIEQKVNQSKKYLLEAVGTDKTNTVEDVKKKSVQDVAPA